MPFPFLYRSKISLTPVPLWGRALGGATFRAHFIFATAPVPELCADSEKGLKVMKDEKRLKEWNQRLRFRD